ncbi:MAG: type II restriction endonuclease, partial [Oxalobacteraceae bacterium]
MPVGDITDWLDEHSGPEFVWYVKRLAANDTLANNTHQAGPYIPREFLFGIFPALKRQDEKNPDVRFDLYIDSHA